MNRGEVWWTDFEPAVGSEIRKIRPAVIISNDAANRHLARVVVVSMTSNTVHLYPGETLVTVDDKTSKVMADQITVADKSRLRNLFGMLSKSDMQSVENAIKVQLAL